ncbi:MAG: peptide ABC transporter substrate-binding protein [Deltaproteobacteria bacterium]|nr:MAG: peptide ABC transporter substrate-binding protein [Deltaproteobacteria bacterium]
MTQKVVTRLVVLLLLSCTVAFAGAGSLTVAQRQDPGSWDPIDTFLVAWSSAAGNMFDGLVLRTEQLELKPGLAERWEVLEDGMRLRFHLRKEVKFHNGEPFNADAVKFTFERLLGQEGAAGPQRSNYTTIERIEIVDPYTVDMVMNTADPVMLTKLSGYGAMIVPPQYIKEKGDDYFNTHPVGTGPFMFKSYIQNDRIELVANPDYFAGPPKLKNLTYRFIREDATRLAELQSGRVDVVHDVAFSAIPIVEGSGTAHIVAVPGPTIYSLQFNTKNGITSDLKVRKALSMAVNKQLIIDTFLAGHGKPIASLQGELSFGFDPELQDYPYDPEQAKQLLAEAGVQPGSAITIDYRANNSAFGEIVQAISSFFNAVGLKVELRPIEDGVFLNEIVPKGKTDELFQFSWGGWTFDFDNTAYLIYHSGERWNPYGTSAELDTMLEEQRKIVDTAKRLEILQKIGRKAHDDIYHLPLYNEDTIYAVSDRVIDFVPAPDRRVRYFVTDVK